METGSPQWKRPDEVMQMHRLKKKKRALQERMRQPLSQNVPIAKSVENENLDFSKLLAGDKRKNPFSKRLNPDNKKFKEDANLQLDESNDKTLFALLNLPQTQPKSKLEIKDLATEKLTTFSNLFQKFKSETVITEEVPDLSHNYIPIDWALKNKLRLMSAKPFAWSQQLKASEEASGITGFVRCLDTSDSNTLDTSPHALFHQNCLYWQHPHLPWIALYPRTTGKVAATSFIAKNDQVKDALHMEWTESFRSLFQLVRARQCPYFYICANMFTCLFRAAGVCGVTETCALISPTTRGFRQILKQEDIEFTMPLRATGLRKAQSSDSKTDNDKVRNSSFDSCYDTMNDVKSPPQNEVKESEVKKLHGDGGSGDEEDLESDQFLEQLGLEAEQIKKINHSQARVNQAVESNVDSAAESMVFVRGVDAQALFNFLLNCKSMVSPTGPFGGIPPTLLAPSAFHGGTLQSLKVRQSVVYSEDKKYYSIEMRGPILPTTVHSLCELLKTNATQFSVTFANMLPTLAFSMAAKEISEDEKSKENAENKVPSVFNEENLSDCGLNCAMLEHFCSPNPDLVQSIDSLKYNAENNTYTWS